MSADQNEAGVIGITAFNCAHDIFHGDGIRYPLTSRTGGGEKGIELDLYLRLIAMSKLSQLFRNPPSGGANALGVTDRIAEGMPGFKSDHFVNITFDTVD